MNYESNSRYLESWSEELVAQANRVRQLIGSRHWLTDGHHKEVIVREFLSRYLPTLLEIGSGFIKAPNGVCSPEIDILISDFSRHPAYFNEGGIQIMPPSSVVAYIEMKSKYSAPVFSKALKTISNTQLSLANIDNKTWRCICFTTINNTFKAFHESVCKQIEKHIDYLNENEVDVLSNQLPTCVTSFDKYIVFINENSVNNKIILNFFDFGKLSISVTFSDLFEEIRVHFGNNGDGELSSMLMKLPYNDYFKYEMEIDNG